MNIFFITLFWLTIILCSATYFLYPLALLLAARLRTFRPRTEEWTPTVTVIISAFNEEMHIERKIQNTLSLGYPSDRMEIIVGSDGSTDRTGEIAAKFSHQGVRLLDFKMNRGKTLLQNDCVEASTGEILIFTDAASFLNPAAVKAIVRNFADPRVGCVAGRLRYVDIDANITTESQGIYWRYELAIRRLESKLGGLIGVDGPLYAIRRIEYLPLEGPVISDFITPLKIRAAGKKVILEESAVADEDPNYKSVDEIRTRRRITARALAGLSHHSELLDPFLYPTLAIQIIFHKVLRWFVGPMIVVNFLSCLFLYEKSQIFHFLTIGYFTLLMLAIFGFISEQHGKKWVIFIVPYYFLLINYAATLGIFDFMRKRQFVTWKPVRVTTDDSFRSRGEVEK